MRPVAAGQACQAGVWPEYDQHGAVLPGRRWFSSSDDCICFDPRPVGEDQASRHK